MLPCTADVATQGILKLAEAADPSGVRTMAVLTKPDLATEAATRTAVIDLVLGRGGTLKLGHYVVKNRSADDTTSTLSDRDDAERAFFMDPAWSVIRDRCGVANLKVRLHELLVQISNQEFPHVRADILSRLRRNRDILEAMGPSRASQDSKRRYLGKLAARFQEVTHAALNGHYTGDKIFKSGFGFKLITKIIKLNEVFANTVWKRGHTQHVGTTWDDEGESALGQGAETIGFDIPLDRYPELSDIICTERYECPKASKGPVLGLIREVYEANRGPELGTVSAPDPKISYSC